MKMTLACQLCRRVASEMGAMVLKLAKIECDQRSGTGNSDKVELETQCDFDNKDNSLLKLLKRGYMGSSLP